MKTTLLARTRPCSLGGVTYRGFVFAALSLALVSSTARTARAEVSTASVDGGSEADALFAAIGSAASALSTQDCTLACGALTSMQKAAERLCTIEPGPRCDEARAKVARATVTVRGACPSCTAGNELYVTPKAEAAPPPSPASADAPAAAPRHGGCAGCAEAPVRGGSSTWLLPLASLIVLALRRRLSSAGRCRRAARRRSRR